MKKTPLFIIAMSAIALASCTEDEQLDVRNSANEPISFRSAMGTRATETTNANLDKIYVTAFVSDSASFDPNSIGKGRHFKDYIATLYFNDAEFDKGSDSFFTAAGTKQYDWLQKDQEINFFAYAPSQDELGADVVVKEDNSGMTLDSFTVADSIGEQVDFMTANATG